MSKRTVETIVLCVLSIGLICLVFFAPGTGPTAREFLIQGAAPTALEDALRENEVLRGKLAKLGMLSHEFVTETRHGVTASVYSEYPFGGRSELIINAGTAEGIAQGDAVLSHGILIGKMGKVSLHTANVITIFDNSFSLTVRVASTGVSGLLVGGNYPMITSMPKGADIKKGDIVISAVPGLPYGLTLGEVNIPVLSSDSLFLEAPLKTTYDLESIESVTVISTP